MKAFHGQPDIKAQYLARVKAHEAADEIIHGKYWEDGKGCAVGCTIHSSNHGNYETELGIPRILARLEDGIFEGMTNGHSQAWPGEFLQAIRVGADLSMVWPRFAIWLLGDKKEGVIRFAKTDVQRKAIIDVVKAYKQVVKTGRYEKAVDWWQLRAAAYAAYAADAAAAFLWVRNYPWALIYAGAALIQTGCLWATR